MASSLKNLSKYSEDNLPDISQLTFGIVVAEWNRDITEALYKGCTETLLKHGAKEEQIHVVQVPGSFELPFGAKHLMSKEKMDAIVCLGCVIQGETKHNEYINHSVSSSLSILSMTTGVPCIFGVLTPGNEQQAKDRAGGKHGNKGVEAAVTAIRMAALKEDYHGQEHRIGFMNPLKNKK